MSATLDPRELVRFIVEECWSDAGALDRMEPHLAPGYVHHTPFGDLTFEQFRKGLAYVESVFTARKYRVEHTIVEGDMVAAYIAWSGTRQADGSPVEGRGTYHCRVTDECVQEDWDVFFPTS